MDTGTFGESLKRERELRGVTLDEISAATRIPKRFLQAIEHEQWKELPGGVFNRGFVRAVARYLGLDEEKTAAEYISTIGDQPSVPVWSGRPPVVTPEQPWLAWIIAAVIVVALVGGAWIGARRFLAWRAAKRTVETAAVSAASSPAPAVAQTKTAVEPAPSGNVTPGSNSPDAASGAPAAATDSASANAPVAPSNDPIELKIGTDKRTKVIVVADKDVVYDGNMKAGENHFFSAADQFQVSTKDAGVVHMALNGKALAPIGPAGHAGKVTLTRDALKGATGGGN